MKPLPPSRGEVRPVAFGNEPAGSERKGDAAAPVALPAWAKPGRPTPVVAWVPASGGARARAATEAPEPAPERTTVPRTFQALKRPPRALAPEEAPLVTPAPEAAAAPAASGQAAIPPGMVLISQEELDRREGEVIDMLQAPYIDAAQRMLHAVDEIEQRLRDDVVDLAARIASVMTNRAVQLDRTITLGIAQRALRLLGPVERVTVKCSEADAELLREHIPALARSEAGRPVEVIVRPSDDIRPGGLVLTFDGGVVDAREERRLARIVEAVKAAVQESDAMLEAAREDQATQEAEPEPAEPEPAAEPDGEATP